MITNRKFERNASLQCTVVNICTTCLKIKKIRIYTSLTLFTINNGFISKRFNTLVFVIEVGCVCCEVETESFFGKQINVRLCVFKMYFRIAERHFTLL